jgi:hypothetical protein
MIATPQFLAHAVVPWASFYGHSRSAPTVVGFLHIGSVVVGGGLAISLDRTTLRVPRGDREARRRHLVELRSVHGWVLGALALAFLSGLALLAADLDTFLGSRAFWTKLGLIALLLANGAMMNRTEQALRSPTSGTADHWGGLRRAAMTSLVLWLVITFAGVVLTNAA